MVALELFKVDNRRFVVDVRLWGKVDEAVPVLA
jgi:hypothetical protein